MSTKTGNTAQRPTVPFKIYYNKAYLKTFGYLDSFQENGVQILKHKIKMYLGFLLGDVLLKNTQNKAI